MYHFVYFIDEDPREKNTEMSTFSLKPDLPFLTLRWCSVNGAVLIFLCIIYELFIDDCNEMKGVYIF